MMEDRVKARNSIEGLSANVLTAAILEVGV